MPKPRPWIEPITLEGAFVRLEPLRGRHAKALADAVDGDTFRYFPTIRADDLSASGIKEYIDRLLKAPRVVPLAVVSRESSKAVGVSCYMDIKPENLGLEIGMTWIGKRWQGTAINPEAKLLLLEHAFERLGAERVQLKCDVRNEQSAAAIAKLGAVREGVIRSMIRAPNVEMTDRILFSIVRREWPAVRAGLVRRCSDNPHPPG